MAAHPDDETSTELSKGSVSLAGLTAESIGTNGPELNAAATTAVIFIFGGAVTPLLFLLALIPGLAFSHIIGRFARSIVSAGGTYQFVRRSLGERTGIVGGSIYFAGLFAFVGGTAALAAYVLGLFGANVAPDASWISGGHWFELAVVVVLVCGVLAWRGINVSVRLLLGLSSFGMAVILILDVVVLASTRDTGFSLSSLLPWNSDISFSNLAVGFGLAMGGFAGVESAAFLGEEAHAPTRMVPRAATISVVLLLLFYFVNALAISKGVGASHLDEVGTQGAGILHTLGEEYIAGWYGNLLLLVVAIGAITSVLGCANACARLLFDMSREGLLPAALGRTHRARRTPHNAVAVVTLGSVLVCLGGLLWQGNSAAAGSTVYGWVLLFGVLILLTAYVLLAIGSVAIMLRDKVMSTLTVLAALIVVVAMSLSIFSQIHPFPPAPFSSAPVVAIAWFLASVAWALAAGSRGGRRPHTEGSVDSAAAT